MRFKSCPKCRNGDLAVDGDEWHWWQCGQRSGFKATTERLPDPDDTEGEDKPKRNYATRGANTRDSDPNKWLERNREFILCVEEGMDDSAIAQQLEIKEVTVRRRYEELENHKSLKKIQEHP